MRLADFPEPVGLRGQSLPQAQVDLARGGLGLPPYLVSYSIPTVRYFFNQQTVSRRLLVRSSPAVTPKSAERRI
jgi:hypothetical protein